MTLQPVWQTTIDTFEAFKLEAQRDPVAVFLSGTRACFPNAATLATVMEERACFWVEFPDGWKARLMRKSRGERALEYRDWHSNWQKARGIVRRRNGISHHSREISHSAFRIVVRAENTDTRHVRVQIGFRRLRVDYSDWLGVTETGPDTDANFRKSSNGRG